MIVFVNHNVCADLKVLHTNIVNAYVSELCDILFEIRLYDVHIVVVRETRRINVTGSPGDCELAASYSYSTGAYYSTNLTG